MPSAGNAAGAASAYAALKGVPLNVFIPRDASFTFIVESKTLGANVTLVDGLINGKNFFNK